MIKDFGLKQKDLHATIAGQSDIMKKTTNYYYYKSTTVALRQTCVLHTVSIMEIHLQALWRCTVAVNNKKGRTKEVVSSNVVKSPSVPEIS